MKICIYGAGAMGTSLGYALEAAGVFCTFVTRNASHVEDLKREGRTACLPADMVGPYDIIFLATKQRENGEIAVFLRDFLAEDGALVTVQNGLPEAALAEVLGADRIYGCALGWGAELADGKLKETSREDRKQLAIGAYGKGARLGELASLLGRAFLVTAGDLAEIRFSKLTVNAAFSTLSAITGCTFGEIAKRYKKQALSMMRETVNVAKAYGCKRLVQNGHNILKFAQSPFAGVILPFAMRRHAQIRSGMLRDIAAGRRCDVDFVAGAVVEAGRKKGVPCPKLQRAVALVHSIENGLAEIAPESILLLEEDRPPL